MFEKKHQHNSSNLFNQISKIVLRPATEFLGPRVEFLHVCHGLRGPRGLRGLGLRAAGDGHGGPHEHRTPQGHGHDAGGDGAGHVARWTWNRWKTHGKPMGPWDKWRSSGTFHGETNCYLILWDMRWLGNSFKHGCGWNLPTIKTMPCWEEENDGYPLNRKPVDHWIIWGPIFQTNPHGHWRTVEKNEVNAKPNNQWIAILDYKNPQLWAWNSAALKTLLRICSNRKPFPPSFRGACATTRFVSAASKINACFRGVFADKPMNTKRRVVVGCSIIWHDLVWSIWSWNLLRICSEVWDCKGTTNQLRTAPCRCNSQVPPRARRAWQEPTMFDFAKIPTKPLRHWGCTKHIKAPRRLLSRKIWRCKA